MLDDMWSEITPELLETLFMQSHTETWDEVHECTIDEASLNKALEEEAASAWTTDPEVNRIHEGLRNQFKPLDIKQVCPECNGTGTYVGFNKTEPCRLCGGK
jgi:DnaJ-class molecular chaperone